MKKFLKRTFGEEFNTLIILNVITCALCLTVVCAGPAIIALTGWIIKVNDDRGNPRKIHEYFVTFKAKFKNGVLFELVLAFYIFILIFSQSLNVRIEAYNPQIAKVISVFIVLGFILAGIVSVCTSTVLGAWKIGFFEGLWNGICLALGRLPRSLMSAICVYGCLYLLYPIFWPVSAVFYIFIMISITCALKLAFLWKPVCLLLLNRDPNFDSAEAAAKADIERANDIEAKKLQEI